MYMYIRLCVGVYQKSNKAGSVSFGIRKYEESVRVLFHLILHIQPLINCL